MPPTPDPHGDSLEIERKFLLSAMPELPPGAAAARIEQGYLPIEGRLRRSTHADGRVVCHLTIKRGIGLVREERESEIPAQEFERDWARTMGRRLLKTRFRVSDDGLTWEIDRFEEPAGLVLAEVELPDVAFEVRVPVWLAPRIVREVTDDPRYTNRAIAMRIAAAGTLPR